MLIPIKIHRPKPYLLATEWSDGFSSTITMQSFRDECPCAMCKGENIMGTTYFGGLTVMKPGMYELASLKTVGNYALQAEWGDGHDTGIYSWEILRAITESNALSPEQMQKLEAKAM